MILVHSVGILSPNNVKTLIFSWKRLISYTCKQWQRYAHKKTSYPIAQRLFAMRRYRGGEGCCTQPYLNNIILGIHLKVIIINYQRKSWVPHFWFKAVIAPKLVHPLFNRMITAPEMPSFPQPPPLLVAVRATCPKRQVRHKRKRDSLALTYQERAKEVTTLISWSENL